MKTTNVRIIQLLLFVLITCIALPTWAQDNSNYVTIQGVVKDQQSNKKLGYASISVWKTNIATISNEDGAFTLRVKNSLENISLEVTRLGYANQIYPVTKNDEDIIILLNPSDKKLQEVTVLPENPLELVRSAIKKVADNNSINTSVLTGFYRETVKKKRNYINISEAIIDIYKTPYTENISKDKVQIHKGRKLLSPKASDTLLVKFQGGPNLSTNLDIVKNKDFILDPSTLERYKFELETPIMLNERIHYVVSFKPQVVLPDALHYGKLYIDKETLAFSRAEFNLSMDDKDKATNAILRKKPPKLKFKPEEVSFLVIYKENNGKSYLNYIRNEIRFKCDWKKRFFFFTTEYTIVSEMVVTDRKEENIEKIPSKFAFENKNSFSDKVSNFYDSNFWEDYNIIEPTESLESAVNKLRKQ